MCRILLLFFIVTSFVFHTNAFYDREFLNTPEGFRDTTSTTQFLMKSYCQIMLSDITANDSLQSQCENGIDPYFKSNNEAEEAVNQFARACKLQIIENWNRCANVIMHFNSPVLRWNMERASILFSIFPTDLFLSDLSLKKINLKYSEYVYFKDARIDLSNCYLDFKLSIENTLSALRYFKELREDQIVKGGPTTSICDCSQISAIYNFYRKKQYGSYRIEGGIDGINNRRLMDTHYNSQINPQPGDMYAFQPVGKTDYVPQQQILDRINNKRLSDSNQLSRDPYPSQPANRNGFLTGQQQLNQINSKRLSDANYSKFSQPSRDPYASQPVNKNGYLTSQQQLDPIFAKGMSDSFPGYRNQPRGPYIEQPNSQFGYVPNRQQLDQINSKRLSDSNYVQLGKQPGSAYIEQPINQNGYVSDYQTQLQQQQNELPIGLSDLYRVICLENRNNKLWFTSKWTRHRLQLLADNERLISLKLYKALMTDLGDELMRSGWYNLGVPESQWPLDFIISKIIQQGSEEINLVSFYTILEAIEFGFSHENYYDFINITGKIIEFNNADCQKKILDVMYKANSNGYHEKKNYWILIKNKRIFNDHINLLLDLYQRPPKNFNSCVDFVNDLTSIETIFYNNKWTVDHFTTLIKTSLNSGLSFKEFHDCLIFANKVDLASARLLVPQYNYLTSTPTSETEWKPNENERVNFRVKLFTNSTRSKSLCVSERAKFDVNNLNDLLSIYRSLLQSDYDKGKKYKDKKKDKEKKIDKDKNKDKDKKMDKGKKEKKDKNKKYKGDEYQDITRNYV